MYTTVRNIIGTTDNKPNGYNSWLDFWHDKTKRLPSFCSCDDCSSSAEVGAHVQEPGNNTSDKWYIVPLCKKCNKKSDSFKVLSINLVPVRD